MSARDAATARGPARDPLREVADGAYAAKGYSYALAAREFFKQGRYSDAASSHATAASFFGHVAKSLGDDSADALAMTQLKAYHKVKHKEMTRRADVKTRGAPSIAASAASTASSASASTSVASPSPAARRSTSPAKDKAAGGTAAESNESQSAAQSRPVGASPPHYAGSPRAALHPILHSPHDSTISAFSAVQNDYENLRKLSSAFDSQSFGAAGAATSNYSNAELLKRAVRESFNDLSQPSTRAGDRRRSEPAVPAQQGESDTPELATLRKKIAALTRENNALKLELQQRPSAPALSDEFATVEAFKAEFSKRFELLKHSMQHFQHVYARGDSEGRLALLENRLISAASRIKALEEKCISKHRTAKELKARLKEAQEVIRKQRSILQTGHHDQRSSSSSTATSSVASSDSK